MHGPIELSSAARRGTRRPRPCPRRLRRRGRPARAALDRRLILRGGRADGRVAGPRRAPRDRPHRPRPAGQAPPRRRRLRPDHRTRCPRPRRAIGCTHSPRPRRTPRTATPAAGPPARPHRPSRSSAWQPPSAPRPSTPAPPLPRSPAPPLHPRRIRDEEAAERQRTGRCIPAPHRPNRAALTARYQPLTAPSRGVAGCGGRAALGAPEWRNSPGDGRRHHRFAVAPGQTGPREPWRAGRTLP
jgi:hypothetical protein